MRSTNSAKAWLKRHLPRTTLDSLRRIKRRTPYLVHPDLFHRLTRMRDQGFDPKLILDVGAAHGDWTIACMRVFPEAQYALIEPLPDYEEELVPLERNPRVSLVVRAAAGRQPGRLPLLVPDEPGGSSFLPAIKGRDGYFKSTAEVPIVTLDSLDLPDEVSLLKLDVQGYELEVISGARRIVREAEVVIAECSLHRFQVGIPLIHEVIAQLVADGFYVYDIAEGVRWNSGTLAQVDVIFVASSSALWDTRWWS